MDNDALEFLEELFPNPNLFIGRDIAQKLDVKTSELVNLMREQGIESLVAAEMEYPAEIVKKLTEEEIKEQQNLIIAHFGGSLNLLFENKLNLTEFAEYVRTFTQVDIATYWILHETKAGKFLNPMFGGNTVREDVYKIYDRGASWEDNPEVIELTMIPVSPEQYSENYLQIQKAIEEVGKKFGVNFGNPNVQLNMSTTVDGENIDDPTSEYYRGVGTNLAIARCKVAIEFSPFLRPAYLFDKNNSYFSLGPTRKHTIKQHNGRQENRYCSVDIFQINPSLPVLLNHVVPLMYVMNSFKNIGYIQSLITNYDNPITDIKGYHDTIIKQKLIVHSSEESKRLRLVFKVLDEAYIDKDSVQYQKNYIKLHLIDIIKELAGKEKAREFVYRLKDKDTILNVLYYYFNSISFDLENKTITWPDNETIIDGAKEFGYYFGYSEKERQGITFTGIENTRVFLGFILGEGIDYSQSLPNIWQQALDRFRNSEIINAVLGKELVELITNESGINPPNAQINAPSKARPTP